MRTFPKILVNPRRAVATTSIYFGVFSTLALAQTDMPVIPPPSQRPPGAQAPAPQPQPQQPLPPGAQPGTVAIEDLARAGFEVKSMVQAGGQAGRYVVLMQRAGDVRTCLLRIVFPGTGGVPSRLSACF